MATFPATYFTCETQYPESGARIQLGRSYQFDSEPEAPDQRIFRLNLQGMQYFLDAGGAIDETPSPGRNMAVLEAFYVTHKRWKTFVFNHPVYGAVNCKFNTPLNIPAGITGGDGVLPGFSVELIEIP